MRRGKSAALVFLCLCLLGGTALASQPLLGAQEREAELLSQPVTRYFRYLDSALLAREQRELIYPRTGSLEMAIIAALIDGPGTLSPALSPLFPPGCQVLNVLREEGRLFVTFNEALMGRYSDEALISSADYRQGEGLLRRRLAMASLVNSLTESGQYSSVQVLVRGETYIATSMRLSQRYYLEDSDALPPPLSRQESYVLSPQSAAGILMAAWQSMNWRPGLRLLEAGNDAGAQPLPSEHELLRIVDGAPKLLHYSVSPGIVALDGQSAVVSLSYRLRYPDGREAEHSDMPLKLLQRHGLYSVPYAAFLRLLEISP